MIYLSEADVKKIFSMRDAIEADREALSLYSQGKTKIPLRTNIDLPDQDGQALYMPGFVGGDKPAMGQKIVTIYPNNNKLDLPNLSATMTVMNADNGQIKAIIEANYLTQLRTGAVQGLATELLSNRDAKKALLIGAGEQGLAQIEAMLTVRNLDYIYIYDIDRKKSENLGEIAAKKFKNQFNVFFESVPDVNEVIASVDIITTVTSSKVPTFDGEMVKRGAHINGVGSYTPKMHELPENILTRSSNIFFDTLDGVLSEAGDIIIPLQRNVISRSDIDGELGQLINGDEIGRTSEYAITVFKTVGTAALDVVVADRIVRLALAKKVGQLQ